MRCHFGVLGLLTALPWLDAAEPLPAHVVIWKFDDLTTGPHGNREPMVNQVVRWAQEQHTPISFGIITNSLPSATPDDCAWLKLHARDNGGDVEFWHHGWTHGSTKDRSGTITAWEFKHTSLDDQIAALTQGCRAMTAATGLTFYAFGAPFNAIDATTPLALDHVPELTIWLYGAPQDTRRTVLSRTLNLEITTGTVNQDAFFQHYPGAMPSCLVLQGHPPCGTTPPSPPSKPSPTACTPMDGSP